MYGFGIAKPLPGIVVQTMYLLEITGARKPFQHIPATVYVSIVCTHPENMNKSIVIVAIQHLFSDNLAFSN